MSDERFPYVSGPTAGRYRIYYVDRTGCQTYATVPDQAAAERFLEAVRRDDDDAMRGRTAPFRS